MKKRLISALLVFVFAVMILPMSFADAASSVGRTTYDEVIKSGNTVICNGESGIYKVTLKNKKPVKIKRLVKFTGFSGAMNMIKKDKYVYYILTGSAAGGYIYRVNIKNAKKKKLTSYLDEADYTLTSSHLVYSELLSTFYYDEEDDEYYPDDDAFNYQTYVANFDGSSARVSDLEINNKHRNTNASSYRVVSKHKGRYHYDYLKTPKGKFYLGKSKKSF